jgi:hypothetical protein
MAADDLQRVPSVDYEALQKAQRKLQGVAG